MTLAVASVPVFQPIVDLATRAVVGYEALTRFVDGSRPDEVFAEAARCDLGIELEAATLVAILDASGPLPGSAWLNLNVSPELVLAGEPLGSLLGRWGRQVVLELTEHIQVTDYPALRALIAGMVHFAAKIEATLVKSCDGMLMRFMPTMASLMRP